MRHLAFVVLATSMIACDRTATVKSADSVAVPSATVTPLVDTAYSEEWNVGDDPDEPEKSVDTRFRVRAVLLRSGTFYLSLDTSHAGDAEKGRPFYSADSVQVTGLTRIDRFTRACKYGAGPWKPRAAIVSDTLDEHDSQPKFIWLLDTANLRLRQLPADSAACFVAGPE